MPPDRMSSNRTASQTSPLAVLSADEEVTLRRVAYGHTEAHLLRPADLERLRRLALIEDGRDGPRLTASGRHHFDGLRRSVLTPAPRHADFQASAAASAPVGDTAS